MFSLVSTILCLVYHTSWLILRISTWGKLASFEFHHYPEVSQRGKLCSILNFRLDLKSLLENILIPLFLVIISSLVLYLFWLDIALWATIKVLSWLVTTQAGVKASRRRKSLKVLATNLIWLYHNKLIMYSIFLNLFRITKGMFML